MWSVWGVCSVLLCAGAVLAQRLDQESMMSHRAAKERDRELHGGGQGEPSCDELKAMWRFSKRQARTPELINEVSTYRDPLMYNEWPVYSAEPRAAPRFRYQYPTAAREAYGRVLTKAPPNVVRTPDYEDDMYGMLNVPHTSGKVLRYPGPSKARGTTFMIPPQRDRFETLKKMIRLERYRELHHKYETDQKQDIKDITSGHSGDNLNGINNYGDQEPRSLQSLGEYPADEPQSRQPHNRKQQSGSRQVSQFSRYSDVMLPPARRSYYPPSLGYTFPVLFPYY